MDKVSTSLPLERLQRLLEIVEYNRVIGTSLLPALYGFRNRISPARAVSWSPLIGIAALIAHAPHVS